MKRVAGFVCLVFVMGCNGSESIELEQTVPVSGIATYEGKPLEGYKVFFSNGDDRTATGLVDYEGHFTLGTNTPGDGAPTGKHRVWLAYEPEVNVEAGKEEEALVLPPSVKIPEKYLNPGTAGLTVEVPEGGLTDHKIELK